MVVGPDTHYPATTTRKLRHTITHGAAVSGTDNVRDGYVGNYATGPQASDSDGAAPDVAYASG
ncbi:hypothetical protein OS42_24540 [Dickeya oryzae]